MEELTRTSYFTAGSLRAAQIESRTRLYTHPVLSLDKLELE